MKLKFDQTLLSDLVWLVDRDAKRTELYYRLVGSEPFFLASYSELVEVSSEELQYLKNLTNAVIQSASSISYRTRFIKLLGALDRLPTQTISNKVLKVSLS